MLSPKNLKRISYISWQIVCLKYLWSKLNGSNELSKIKIGGFWLKDEIFIEVLNPNKIKFESFFD